MTPPDDARPTFGDLRALLSQGAPPHLAQLLPVLERARAHAPERFEAEWLPYMQGFAMPRASARTLRQLEHICAHMPPTTPLRTTLSTGPGKHTRDLMGSPLLERVTDIHVTDYEDSSMPELLWETTRPEAIRSVELSLGRDPRPWLRALNRHAPSLKALHRLWFSDVRWSYELLKQLETARFPALKHISLLFGDIEDVDLRKLTSASWFGGIQSLDLRINDLSSESIDHLSAPNLLPGLRNLALQGNPLHLEDFESLAAAPWAGGLRTLDLCNTAIHLEHTLTPSSLAPFERLETLGLSSNYVEAQDLAALEGLPALRAVSVASMGLRQAHLDVMTPLEQVNQWSIDENDLSELDLAPFLTHRGHALVHLDMDSCQLSAAQFNDALRTANVGSLQTLLLNHNAIDNHSVDAIIRCDPRALRTLEIQHTHVDTQGVEALSRSALGASLHHFDCGGCALGPEAAQALGAMRNLKTLHFMGNNAQCALTDRGVARLARHAQWTQLRALDLSANALTDEGARALARAPWMCTVHSLTLRNNRITERGWEALRASPYTSPYLELG